VKLGDGKIQFDGPARAFLESRPERLASAHEGVEAGELGAPNKDLSREPQLAHSKSTNFHV
jgi:hypothetical protein